MGTRNSVMVAAVLVLLSASACKPEPSSEKNSAPAPAVQTGAVAAQTGAAGGANGAKQMFAERCSPCHGPSGKGDGVAAAALNPKPRNYTDKAWQASVTDEQIRKTIIYGGAAVGKSAVMPSSPDLDAKPEIVDGLVKMVRSFGGT